MHFSYVILADAATAAEGKLYLHGGGIARIYPQALPWIQPQLAVAARLVADDEALPAEHTLVIVHRSPQGSDIGTPITFDFVVQPDDTLDGEQAQVNVALTFNNLSFNEPGRYGIHFLLDGVEKHIESYTVMPPPTGAPEPAAS